MFGDQPILIVEDESIVALDLAMAVEDHGGRVIGPVATVAEALELIDTQPVAAAILDAILRDRDVTPLALRLVERKVPFIIHTGTGLPLALAMLHPHLPLLRKPQQTMAVLGRLLDEMRGCIHAHHSVPDDMPRPRLH
jgi:DNA-binding NtrC family response regulator